MHIEPFTVDQAKEFIDKRLGVTPYDQQYRAVRDHIILSVEGFFRNESEISRNESNAFIGYAPVLLSIAVLLKKTNNFKALHEELLVKNDRGVELILEITTLILKRDREEKILPVLREQLLSGRDVNFVEEVEFNAYSNEEQCVRILYFLLGIKPDLSLTCDTIFNQQYEQMADEWLKEHPFIQNGKIQNAVFESFVIAVLMKLPKHQSVVLRYLQTKYRSAFMLFFVFDKLSSDRVINATFLPYLFSSLKSLDDKSNFYEMDIFTAQDYDADITSMACVIEFDNMQVADKKYEFKMDIAKDATLVFDAPLSNVDINVPVTIHFKANRLELGSPILISCSRISISASEFVFEYKRDGDIILECEKFEIDYSIGLVPSLFNYSSGKTQLMIICEDKPEFPFSSFYHNGSLALSKINSTTIDKYLRLRKILMQFRSHSKGELAKLKDKIEHPRTLKNDLGWTVLNMLKSSGIIFQDSHLYKVNPNALDEHLGISYQDLKKKIITPRTIEFLEKK